MRSTVCSWKNPLPQTPCALCLLEVQLVSRITRGIQVKRGQYWTVQLTLNPSHPRDESRAIHQMEESALVHTCFTRNRADLLFPLIFAFVVVSLWICEKPTRNEKCNEQVHFTWCFLEGVCSCWVHLLNSQKTLRCLERNQFSPMPLNTAVIVVRVWTCVWSSVS